MNYFLAYLAKIEIFLIKIYQKTLSFDHGFIGRIYGRRWCRFHPTCSDYTIQAIEKYGPLKGLIKGWLRILRCNPWSKGGYDPLK